MNSNCISIKLCPNNVRYNLIVWAFFAALYGYYLAIKQSPLEREIRKINLITNALGVKKIFYKFKKCPKCSQITIYGTRKKIFG